MSFRKLVEHFQSFANLPIEVDDVRDWIQNHCREDQIVLYLTGMDPVSLRGWIVRYRQRPAVYAPLEDIAEIHISEGMPLPWQRLVACKEMIHLLDHTGVHVRTWDALDRLIQDVLGSRLNPGQAATMSLPGMIDNLALVKALFVLCPLDIIKTLRPAYAAGTVSTSAVAKIFEIPDDYVALIMDPAFDTLMDLIID
jgi:hypothetical protein